MEFPSSEYQEIAPVSQSPSFLRRSRASVYSLVLGVLMQGCASVPRPKDGPKPSAKRSSESRLVRFRVLEDSEGGIGSSAFSSKMVEGFYTTHVLRKATSLEGKINVLEMLRVQISLLLRRFREGDKRIQMDRSMETKLELEIRYIDEQLWKLKQLREKYDQEKDLEEV